MLTVGLVVAGLCGVLALGGTARAEDEIPEAEPVAPVVEPVAPAMEPKPLSENVNKGLAWLIEHQHKNGGWAQGEESKQMGHSLDKIKDKPNIADTCAALLALSRSGSTPTQGPYAKNILKGIGFVCEEVEAAEDESLWITSVRGTRLQSKLGTYIDTFLAALVLAEFNEKMPDEAANKRIFAALDKVMDKIEKNQRADGTWDNRGWATDLAQGLGTKALNTASRSGRPVAEKVRERAEDYSGEQYDGQGGFKVGKGAAGVELYASSAAVSGMQQSEITNKAMKKDVERQLAEAKTDEERDAARATLNRFAENERALAGARSAIVKKVEDKRFIAGFGSNGGEEFLSYLNIGETMVLAGGQDWEKWDKAITDNLNRIQNNDGSWTGHHCITGRTFCTSAALMVLMVDRTPRPVAEEFKKR